MRNVVNGPQASEDRASEDRAGAEALDLAFLRAQTFGDEALERDVLALFVAQARRVLPTLPELAPAAQRDAAHLLKGSCQGIGARRAAEAADRYGLAESGDRAASYPELAAAFDAVLAAADTRLAAL